MTDVTITDAAVEAAIAALVARVFGGLAAPSPQALTLIREDLTAELAAAAPYIAAQALRDYRDYIALTLPNRVLVSTAVIHAELNARIDQIEADHG